MDRRELLRGGRTGGTKFKYGQQNVLLVMYHGKRGGHWVSTLINGLRKMAAIPSILTERVKGALVNGATLISRSLV